MLQYPDMVKDTALNPQQIEAITHGEGPLLIIAGAGTGKTTVITERVKHVILERKINPTNILALTFTEKAASEMEERIDISLPYGYTQLWIATFHAFCDRILRSDAIHIGLNPGYTLTTESESIMFIRSQLFKFDLNYFRPLGNPYKFIEGLLKHFSRLKDEDISPDEYLSYAKTLPSTTDMDELKKIQELANAYALYEQLKIKEGIMDFSDLISSTLRLFRTRNNILQAYQDQFAYILIDEFQDTNFAQNQLAVLLAGKRKNITVVADDDQAIYKWRGAAISNVLQFRKHFPDVTLIPLTTNYRSTANILDASYKLIQNNNPDRLEVKEQIDKKLIPARRINGDPVDLLFADRVENEAELVTKKIIDLMQKKKYDFKSFAILVRANDHAQPFLRSLERSQIPYQFLGPGQLFHQEEIKDLIAYLKVLYNFEDSASLYRVLHMPPFGLSARDIAAVLNFSKRKNIPLFEALERIDEMILVPDVKEKILGVVSMIRKHLERVSKDTAGQILYYFLQDTNLLTIFVNPKNSSEEARALNIAKLFDKLKSYEGQHEDASVFAVVDWIDLSMQMGESPLAANSDWSENNAVNILTVHSSKGLEFPVVFLINAVSQRFPTRERREQIPIPQDLIKEILPEGDYHLEEERRLFYVGMTRARNELYITGAKYYGEGKRERKLSPFVYEALGEALIEKRKAKASGGKQLSLLDMFPAGSNERTTGNKEDQFQITYLSYSQIQTFEICPLHYKLKYLLKIPAPLSASQSFGTSVHAALRDFYQKRTSGSSDADESIHELLKNVWIDEGYASKSHQKKAFERGVAILEDYLKHNYTKDNLPIALELPFNFTLRDTKKRSRIKIGGRIDRIDKVTGNKIDIIDYKTGSNIPDEKELKNSFQMTIYALAATEVQDAILNRLPEDIILSLHYLEEGKKVSATRSVQQLAEAKEIILAKLAMIENSDFACSKSNFCTTCEYKMLCNVH